MLTVILEQIMHLMIVLPLILFTTESRKLENLKVLLVFALFFICNGVLLHLPILFDELNIINTRWNWMGKIFAITGSVIFLLVYKKFELKDYFITFHQNKEHLKKALITVLVVFTVATVMNVTFSSPREWNVESIAYQLTMPGLNEEIVYRGILLGLLVKILNPNSFLHPAILATALLFGMAHGLILNESYEVVFKAQAFFETMIMGMIWAWVTLKTGSIMLALLSHNLGNASGHLISMIK